MLFSKETYITSFLTVLLSTTALIPAADAQNSGRVGAVNLDATGTPPGAGTRTLTIGTNIIYKERVQTSAQGSTQIMFPDTSTLNVGRNSNIVIDEYVYDPAAGTGKMVATVSKGVMRFVGGQISHTAGVTVEDSRGDAGHPRRRGDGGLSDPTRLRRLRSEARAGEGRDRHRSCRLGGYQEQCRLSDRSPRIHDVGIRSERSDSRAVPDSGISCCRRSWPL